MRRIKTFLTILSLTSSATAAQYKLDESKVIELALKRNETVGIAAQELEQAKEELSKANSNYFPTLSVSASVRKSDGEGNFLPYGYDWNHSGEIRLTQPIYTFGKITSGKNLAKSGKRISELNENATNAEVKNLARQLYYRVLFNKELVKITADSYQNASKNKKALEDRVSYGRISRNDNLKMQADLASRKPNWIIAKKNLQNAILDLKNYLDLDFQDKVTIESKRFRAKEALTKVDDLEKLNETVDLKVLEENIKLSDFSLDLAKAQRLPDLGFFVSYAPTKARKDLFSGEITHDQKDISFGMQFTFDWDLGGSKNSEVAIKRSDRNIANLRLKQMKREIRTQYLKLKQDYEGLQEKFEAESEAVQLASSSYRVALSSFRSGGVSQLQLNDSEIQLTQNRLSLAQTKLQIQITRAEMDRLLTKTSSKNKGGR